MSSFYSKDSICVECKIDEKCGLRKASLCRWRLLIRIALYVLNLIWIEESINKFYEIFIPVRGTTKIGSNDCSSRTPLSIACYFSCFECGLDLRQRILEIQNKFSNNVFHVARWCALPRFSSSKNANALIASRTQSAQAWSFSLRATLSSYKSFDDHGAAGSLSIVC